MEDLGLGIDNLLDDNDFMSLDDLDLETPSDEEKETDKETDTAEGVVVDFDEPEGVSSEENNEDTGEGTSSGGGGTSPDNFFSSIATAIAEEGIFPDLDDDTVKNVKTAKDLVDVIDKQVDAKLTEQQKRVKKALDNNVETDAIRYYENLLTFLDNAEKKLDEEGDEADNLRKQLIYQDCINKKFSKERAAKYVERAFADGTEKEEAKEALKSNRDFYEESYNSILDEKENEAKEQERKREEKANKIKKSIAEDNFKFFGDIELTKQVRQMAYDAISKPVYKDPDTGEYFTALQKLEHDNSEEFMAKLGLIYALTDGFSTIDKLVGKKVKKEVKKGFSNLENVLQNTARDKNGNLKFVSSDPDSFASNKVRYPDFKTL